MKKLSLLLLVCLTTQAMAQKVTFFNANGRYMLNTDKARTASVAAGDIDGDGDIDIVAANGRHWPDGNELFINNGYGKFTVSRPLDDLAETSYAAELADLDGDGDLDLAVGNDMAPNGIYLNDGQGHFTSSSHFGGDYTHTRNLNLTYLDQDCEIDNLITHRGRVNELCLHEDKARFDQVIPS